MSNSICFTPLASFNPHKKTGTIVENLTCGNVIWISRATLNPKDTKFQGLEVKATQSNPGTKLNSIVCAKCDGNGAIVCSQCKGDGVNSVDHFNGRFKAGGICWLCRGKREILCGDCNGAGFCGGFMSSSDE